MAKKKAALGQGLDALFGDNTVEDTGGAQTLRMSDIEPNRGQPRQHFDEAAITDLADSIRQHGLIQPIVVRPMESGGYQIVAGERRWRACRMLGMTEVPAVIREFTDFETAQIALIENIQREDLNPIEEAAAYRTLMDEYSMTQEQLSKAVGKSRSAIANSVRLLNLPEPVIEMLKKREISTGQAKALAAADSDEKMIELAKEAAAGKLTVRGIEKLLSKSGDGVSEEGGSSKKDKAAEKAQKQNINFVTEMQISLENHLGKKVRINTHDGEKGTISIDFYSQDELSELADKLTMY
ncbi:MAG: ParB/RepB/Spo0J family partition protein [Oscillospiraceae bacterium]|nr:ParB/RepB/Spo0J family partition protein [Oscillospiraceae bacterium]